MAETPMMEQYRKAKEKNRDAVLFFRLGDFYEMFFEDAIEVSALLNLTLTKRQGEAMCGIPWHSSRSYIARLLKAGRKVAICEQVGEIGKGIVRREVVEVITPGTAMEEDYLDRTANNWIVALCSKGQKLGCAWLDLGTAEFFAERLEDEEADRVETWLARHLYRLDPRELVVQQSLLEDGPVARCLSSRPSLILDKLPDWSFDSRGASEELATRFGLSTLKGLGFEDSGIELAAARALLRYVDGLSDSTCPHVRRLLPWHSESFARIDEATQKNLELVRNLNDSSRSFSLLDVLDFTRTGPGSRLLRQWLLEPLTRREAIESRLDAVDFLYRRQKLLGELRHRLGRVLDTERLASRVAMRKAHAKDLLALRDSIEASVGAHALVAAAREDAYAIVREEAGALVDPMRATGAILPEGPGIEGLLALSAEIGRVVKDEPSILLTEGNLVRREVDPELERLHGLHDNARGLLEAYLEEEKTISGISNLRIRYNRIIGYYLEVSKGRLDAVPAHFMRRQSLVNGERFSTQRLGELEADINGASEKIVELERGIFLALRERVAESVPTMLELARSTSILDCLSSFAWAATERGYTRPRIVEEAILKVTDGRHPVVEAHVPAGAFVPNGIGLDADPAGSLPSFALITGPNMAGKSTFLRQMALIAIMAQAGSFVPAAEAEIGIADRIFCRVGAHDDLARGESTFLVEMHETARILNTATRRSLVVMDEVGRGTGTLDGLSIAWAVTERLLDGIGARTLFATHYHELTALEHPRLGNFSLAVLEEEGDVVFLKRVEKGPALGSYGLHVARLAGVPDEVIRRARELRARLSALEAAGAVAGGLAASGGVSKEAAAMAAALATPQGPARPTDTLFDPRDLVLAELASIDTDRLSPLEALNRLAGLKAGLLGVEEPKKTSRRH
ncbi:MAG TPA: DNA mismatch repair protein MutS [Rectinemataceae bacterium]|nr:DNA mismatch repair protein MutS [Rectinemataceae bacterium]